MTGSRIKRRSDQPGYCFDKPRIRGIAAHNPRWAFNPMACGRGTPSGERRSRCRRRELRIERQANDFGRRPIGDLSRGLLAGGVPIAHGDKTPVLRPQNCFERSCLRLSVGEQRRPAAELTIDLLRYPASTPRDNARQRQPNERRQTEDGRVAEQVEKKGLHRFQPVRTPKVHQHDRGTRHVSQPSVLPEGGRAPARFPAVFPAAHRGRD